MNAPVGVASQDRYARRPRGFIVIPEPPEEPGAPIDWSSWYLTDEEDMAHAPEHNEAAKDFASSLQELVRERGGTTERIGEDEFFAWVKEEPLVRVSPDVFIQSDPPPSPHPRSWQTWLPGHLPPRFALEIVWEDWKKDYEDNPAKYWQLGTQELVIFDPEAELRQPRGAQRVPLQVYRRSLEGAFIQVYAGNGPVRSHQLDAWLVVRDVGPVRRLRLARDPQGKDLVPTVKEARDAEAQRADHAEQRADHAEQRAARLAARLRELGIDPERED